MKTQSFLTIVLAALASIILVSCSTSSTSAGGIKPYPHDTCIVADKKLGSMGDPVTIVHQGQEVKFCCQPCVKKFQSSPEKYLSKL